MTDKPQWLIEEQEIFHRAALARLTQLGEGDFIQRFGIYWELAKFPLIPFQPDGQLGELPDGEYVYVIAGGRLPNTYKIGRSNVIKQRMKGFAVKLPLEIEYTILLRVKDSRITEKSLHKFLSSQRGNGEFFKLGLTDLLGIASYFTRPLESWLNPKYRRWVNSLVPDLVTEVTERRQPIEEEDKADLLDGLF